MNLQVRDMGYFLRTHGPEKPAGDEIHSTTPIILTPERMAYSGWWGNQHFGFHKNYDENVPFMVVSKEIRDGSNPTYSVMWMDSSANGAQKTLAHKLSPIAGLHARLSAKGYDLGVSEIHLRNGRTSDSDEPKIIPIDKIYTPENQQLISAGYGARVKSNWLNSHVHTDRYNRVVVRAEKYFGAEQIVVAIRDSFFESDQFSAEDFDKMEMHLDDILRDFPEAPKVKP